MKIIPDGAEERETKACPAANNSDTIRDAADKLNGAASGEEAIPQQPKVKSHCYCPILAKEHGENAAAILQGLGYKVAKSKNIRDGRKWFYDSLEALEERWPYLSSSGIHAILQRQSSKGNVFKGCYNKMYWMDRTTWYSVTEKLVKRALDDEGKVWFDVPAAVQCHSIIAGTIYQNIRYHLLAFLAGTPEFRGVPYYEVNKSALSRVLNCSLSTVKREFNALLEHKFIAVNPEQPRQYTICNMADLIVPDAMKNNASKSGSEMEMGSGSFLEHTGSQMEKTGSQMEKTGSEMESNTHYKPFERHIHKHHSPNAAREVCGECADAAGAANESGHGLTCDNTSSSTLRVKENQATCSDDEVPKDLNIIRACIKALSAKISEAEQMLVAASTPGIAMSVVCDGWDQVAQYTAWKSADQNTIISAIAPDLHQGIMEHGTYLGWSREAWKLSFCHNLEAAVGAFMLCNGDTKLVKSQFIDSWDSVKEVHRLIRRPVEFTDIPAQAKADLFINEIRRSNKDGWPTYSNGEVDFTVSPSKAAGEAARAFFEANSELSANDVWSVLADCVEVCKLNDKPAKYDPLFYSRRGIRPKFLFDHWYDIKAELDAADTLVSS